MDLATLPAVDGVQILHGLPEPVIVVDRNCLIRFVNFEAQRFLDAGESALVGQRLDELLPADSPIFLLIAQVLSQGRTVSEYGVILETPRIGRHTVTITAGPMGDRTDHAVVTLHEVSIARLIDKQLNHRNAARSVTAMAAMLAHEVKNPLSGIRGAAQLLEENASDPDRELTRLICDEADRIVALVNRMEVFSDQRPIEREAVNIHAVLERVRKVSQTGFARRVRFVERYDPSLPPVHGNHDQLVQVFLNLVKNAAEAAPADNPEIVLTTAYQRGVSIAIPGTNGRMNLPLAVTIQDNGEGIPEDLHQHLFDPFVSTKANGSGLGLALVAKIVGDHGGVVDFDSRPRRTVFRVSLPIAVDAGNLVQRTPPVEELAS
ncbi:ATP-binding protein [Inquilinus sp. CAU 1745]|uniref:two-component system sensor histidine kinase NtrB n=1 Tax=Inquilinus sp. CAU 1745 TaxID=3140369 RepID=UPI00325BCCC5